MSVIASVLLASAADAFIGVLVETVTGELRNKLKRDPAKVAYKQALGAAIDRYASVGGLGLAGPLLQKKGILTDTEVATELSQLVRFERRPDVALIAHKWQAATVNPPTNRDFAREAEVLIGYLEEELRKTAVFRPVFEARDLQAIALSSKQSTELLSNIEERLTTLVSLLSVDRATSTIRDEILDPVSLIEEKTLGFVGRQWVFEAIDNFLQSNPRGYFFISGDPGIGKTALAAQLVKQRGYINHFNRRHGGINKTQRFLRNVCAQLIAVYRLDYSVLPRDVGEDGAFLNKLLAEVSARLKPKEQCVVVVDALDEAARNGEGNLLNLPDILPPKVYVVVTMRPEPGIRPRIEVEHDDLLIQHDSADNLADVRDYVTAATARAGIQKYLRAQAISANTFIDQLVEMSEGNFMYLHHVLPEIDKGAYQDLELQQIPKGLENYYEDHWKRMKIQDKNAWFEYKLHVLEALTVSEGPTSIDLLCEYARVPDRQRVKAVLEEWSAFLHEQKIEFPEGPMDCYSLYHASFFDFIKKKQEAFGEGVDLRAMHAQIADVLFRGFFSGE